MHTTTRAFAAAALVLLPAFAWGQDKAAAKKKLYCWMEDGRKVCGDALPADAVDAERTELSAASGRATARLGRALTDEERKAEAARLEAERLQALRKQQAQRQLHAMVESYATEDDLRRSFGERIVLLDEGMKASRLGVATLRQSLVTLLRRAAEAELSGGKVAKKLADDIQRQHGDLKRQQAMLQRQIEARAQVDAELDEALTRYRELKAQRAKG